MDNEKLKFKCIKYFDLMKRANTDPNPELYMRRMELGNLTTYKFEGEEIKKQSYNTLDSSVRTALEIESSDIVERWDREPRVDWVFDLSELQSLENYHSKLFAYLTMPYWSTTEAAYLLNWADQVKMIDRMDSHKATKSDPSSLMLERIRRAAVSEEIKRKGMGVDPKSVFEWAKENNVIIPKILDLKCWLTDDEIKQREVAESTSEKIEVEGSLTGPERQELGRLRQERDKWETSIKGAVHAALFSKEGNITRDNLKDALHKFDLPDTTIETIWKALRDEGLTKGPGRPKSTK